MHFDNNYQAERAMTLAIGRIFRLGSRPSQPGDTELYEEAKRMCLHAGEYLGIVLPVDVMPNYTRDYYKIHHD